MLGSSLNGDPVVVRAVVIRNLSCVQDLAGVVAQSVTMPRPKACVVYVGDLPSDVRTREIEDVFYKVGYCPVLPRLLMVPYVLFTCHKIKMSYSLAAS